jgi:alkanesulfonate monooxygenase SsuD/methylene tetrahydromethanopterin reductase-like flavin-dependent oxidoreductase (luciferase family)
MGLSIMAPIAERSPFGGTPRFSDMLEITRTAEAIGLDAVWLPDHLVMQFESEGNVVRGVWEAWTTLAAIAAATTKVTLGVLVTSTSFRHPGIIAKMAENLDEISNGRFILGLGAGWHKPEYDQFGFPFDHRVSRFEEAINIIAPMLREGRATFHGTYYQVNNVVNQPRGPRAGEGGPPILIGTGSPRMMRLTARFADAWNGDWHRETSSLVPLLERLDEACADVGRDPATMVRSSSSAIAMPGYLGVRANPIAGDNEQIAESLAAFRDLGIQHHVAGLDPCTPTSVEQYSRVVEPLDLDS